MADRVVENQVDEVPEMPELLERVMLFALDEAREKMDQAGEVAPFTCLVIKENLFIETYQGEPDECFAGAKRTVAGARGADAYAFCYDGYVETDEGDKDVLIAEGGLPGIPEGHAIGMLYEIDDEGTVTFEEEVAYIGEAPNFMADLNDASFYGDDEIDQRYIEPDEFEFVEEDDKYEA